MYWDDVEISEDWPESKLVGIWANGSAFYCETTDDVEYSVINGAWEFYIDHGVARFLGNHRSRMKEDEIFSTNWRIVLPEMESMNYNDACELIKKTALNQNHSSLVRSPVVQPELPFLVLPS